MANARSKKYYEMLDLADQLILLAKKGESLCEHDDCIAIFGLVRESAFKIQTQAKQRAMELKSPVCKKYVEEAMDLSKKLIVLAKDAESHCEHDECLLLYGLIRDSAYKLLDQARDSDKKARKEKDLSRMKELH